ncbi:hypothetical protein FOL47_009547 [Perkinsus chesapeaki]|uniref:Uncharacterized protein n=1 Tax=Perkinsus chesapeaki TaxID=330153 RepID=A0A7J6L7N3_PERCH|nr:hypothetical protein FOL47_009547 [Perkinsus chesapeaki]
MSASPSNHRLSVRQHTEIRANRTSVGSVASEGEVRSVKHYKHRGSRHRPEVCYYPNSQDVLSEVDIKPFCLGGTTEWRRDQPAAAMSPGRGVSRYGEGDGMFRYADDENESDVSNAWSAACRGRGSLRPNVYPASPLSQVPISPYMQRRAVSPLLRGMTPTRTASPAARAVSPYMVRSANAAVSRQFSSPVPSSSGCMPARAMSVAGAFSPSGGVSQASPGRVVSRRIIRYASPVPSRVTTTRYCRSASPMRRDHYEAYQQQPPGSVPAESKRYALDLNTEEDVAFKSATNTFLMTQPQEEPNASRLSWGACNRQMLEEDRRLRYPRVDPPDSTAAIPYTARPSPRGSSPAAARRCVDDAVGAMLQLAEEDESLEMEPDPMKSCQPKRSSEELMLLSDSDESVASPPRKKRTSLDRQPRACRTPVATAATQTENALKVCVGAEPRSDQSRAAAASPGRPEFGSFTGHSCECSGKSRSYTSAFMSPSYADRARALQEKEVQLEKFLQESARRRARLMDSIQKRKREVSSMAVCEEDEEFNAPIRGLKLPMGSAEGRWAEAAAGGGSVDAPAAMKAAGAGIAVHRPEGGTERREDRPTVDGSHSTGTNGPRRPSSPVPASHGVFVKEGQPSKQRRRSSWHGDPNRTVFGDTTPLPLHGSYHRTVVPKANKLHGRGETYAPIDDAQWRALAEKLRQKADSYAISTE